MRKIMIMTVAALAVLSILFSAFSLPIRAQEEDSSPEIMKKLDDIMKGQKEIMDALAAVKEELGVIKVRVTQMQ